MSDRPLFVLTGATSGLGLSLARRLAHTTHGDLVVGARTPDTAGALRAAIGGDRLTLLPLDLASPASVAGFAEQLRSWLGTDRPIDAIVCNAGLQAVGPPSLTADGIETTFAVNHLGHFALVHRLLDRIVDGGVVVSIASGTHNPNDRMARLFGFRGGLFPDAAAVSAGDLDDTVSPVRQGQDRYATSKLCNILFTKEMARRVPAARVRFVAFDPGLMPGTGLARERSALARFGWARLMPAFVRAIPGASTPARSAAILADRIITPAVKPATGTCLDFRGRPAAISTDAEREDLARDLFAVSERLTGLTPAA